MKTGLKLCRYCKRSYPPSEFGVALTTESKIYYRHKCRACYRRTKQILQQKYRTWLVDYKKRYRCARCKVADHRVLEFHHLDRAKKEFGIAVAFYNHYGLERIKKEVAKCAILCANCHRIAHYEQRGRGVEKDRRSVV